jgi:GINS complex subunit 2
MKSLKDSQRLTCEEVEFFAEDELIEIIPSVKLPVINLITGDFGPFEVGIPVTVPLWLAVSLKETKRCRILPPSWLTEENILAKVEEERNNPNSGLVQLHRHYMEIASKLLLVASDDLQQPFRIRKALEDLLDLRTSKLRKGLLNVRERTPFVKINRASWMELNSLREPLFEVLCTFASLDNSNETVSWFTIFGYQFLSFMHVGIDKFDTSSKPECSIPRSSEQTYITKISITCRYDRAV